MKAICNICLGNFMQSVSFADDVGMVKVEKVSTPELPIFLAKLEDIDEIILRGPETYIKKVQKDTESQMENSKLVKFTLM